MSEVPGAGKFPDTELNLRFSDTPTFGRRYSILPQSGPLGTLEVFPGHPYSAETPNVRTEIELNWVRLLTFNTIGGFLADIALHVCDMQDIKEDSKSRATIDYALTRVLWQTQQISEFGMEGEDYGELELQLNGSAVWYFERKQALRKQRAQIAQNEMHVAAQPVELRPATGHFRLRAAASCGGDRFRASDPLPVEL